MKKGTLVIFFSMFLAVSSLFAQTEAERLEIIKDYDLEKLAQLEADYAESFAREKQQALNLAILNGWDIEVELPNGGIAVLVGVFADGSPKYYATDNREGGITTRANRVHTGGSAGLDLNGENMTAGIWDGGRVRASHQLIENRATQIDNPGSISNHSTHVAGTMIGSGAVQSGGAKGMAPLAELVAYDFSNDESEMTAAAATGLLISNHSYGIPAVSSSGNPVPLYYLGYYDGNARNIDNIVYNAPYYLPVCSAGNDRQSGANTGDGGYDYLTDKSVAKNNLVCAAVNEVLNYTGPSSVIMSSFSSWGPTDDGRVKPDISAKGVNMFSSTGSSDASYANYNGTSMATPNTSGSLILLQQHYNDINGEFMLSSSLRGLALHTADEAGSAPGPDYRYGWGLMNTERAAEVITNNGTTSLIIEETIQEGEAYTFSVQADGINDLVASLTWVDPAGILLPPNVVDLSTPSLVNDLDIRVSQDGGATFLPWKLDPANFNAPATNGDNIVDNFEKIEIAGATGEYIIQVSHKGFLTNDSQTFSLILTGISLEQFAVTSHDGIKKVCPSDGLVTMNVDLTFSDGFSDTINFTVTESPAGTTAVILPTSLSTEGTAVVTVSGINSLAPGDYPVNVTATGTSETINLYMFIRIPETGFTAVDLVSPADDAVDLSFTVDFVWDEGEPFTEEYDFELALDENFTVLVAQETTNNTFTEVSGLVDNTEYFWRVRAKNLCADGPYSDIYSFTTVEILGVNENTIEGLVAYPNPTTSILNIEAATSIGTIEVYNVLGQSLILVNTDSNKAQIDISSLQAGNYFVRVTAQNNSSVLQVVKR